MIPDLTALSTEQRETLISALREISSICERLGYEARETVRAVRFNHDGAAEKLSGVVADCKLLGNWGKQIEEMCK